MNKILGVLLGVVVLISCSKDDEFVSAEEQLAKDVKKIDEYLQQNNILALEHISGIRYVISEEGTGVSPNINNVVVTNYAGRFMSNGKEFDSGSNVKFPLSGVIQGWQIGIPLLKEGGSGTLYIPSGYAYGPRGRDNIPGNAILIFDVDLLEVE